jgi:hypothetical protein
MEYNYAEIAHEKEQYKLHITMHHNITQRTIDMVDKRSRNTQFLT